MILRDTLVTAPLGILLILTITVAAESDGCNGTRCLALTLSSEKRLINQLLEMYHGLGRTGRPVKNTSTSVPVEFGLGLIQMDLDEKYKVLKMSMWSRYKWKDEYLQWDPEDYDGVDKVRIAPEQIWVPDIMLYNTADPHDKAREDVLAVVQHDGTVLWVPHQIFKSSCSIDVTNFPFDSQNCHMWFGSWTYSRQEVDVEMGFQSGIDLSTFQSDYKESSEWEILQTVAEKKIMPSVNDTPNYAVLTFQLDMKRKVVFSSYILTLPCVFLACLTLVVFWLPPDRPDRTALVMSVTPLGIAFGPRRPPVNSGKPHRGQFHKSLVSLDHFTNLSDFENTWNLFSFFSHTKKDIYFWLRDRKLMAAQYYCPHCEIPCYLGSRPDRLDGFTFRCPNSTSHEFSLRNNSIFSNFRYSLPDIFVFLIHFAKGYSLKICAAQAGINYNSMAPRWARIIRTCIKERMWVDYFGSGDMSKCIKLSGTVQLDEMWLGRKIKFHRGKKLGKGVWIFGLIETETGRVILFPIDKRDKPTLNFIVENFVQYGSTLESDTWSGYADFNELPYDHFSSCHRDVFSQAFINIVSKVVFTISSNMMEGYWKILRQMWRNMNGTTSYMLESHLMVAQWRRKCDVDDINPLDQLAEDMRLVWPTDKPGRITHPTKSSMYSYCWTPPIYDVLRVDNFVRTGHIDHDESDHDDSDNEEGDGPQEDDGHNSDAEGPSPNDGMLDEGPDEGPDDLLTNEAVIREALAEHAIEFEPLEGTSLEPTVPSVDHHSTDVASTSHVQSSSTKDTNSPGCSFDTTRCENSDNSEADIGSGTTRNPGESDIQRASGSSISSRRRVKHFSAYGNNEDIDGARNETDMDKFETTDMKETQPSVAASDSEFPGNQAGTDTNKKDKCVDKAKSDGMPSDDTNTVATGIIMDGKNSVHSSSNSSNDETSVTGVEKSGDSAKKNNDQSVESVILELKRDLQRRIPGNVPRGEDDRKMFHVGKEHCSQSGERRRISHLTKRPGTTKADTTSEQRGDCEGDKEESVSVNKEGRTGSSTRTTILAAPLTSVDSKKVSHSGITITPYTGPVVVVKKNETPMKDQGEKRPQPKVVECKDRNQPNPDTSRQNEDGPEDKKKISEDSHDLMSKPAAKTTGKSEPSGGHVIDLTLSDSDNDIIVEDVKRQSDVIDLTESPRKTAKRRRLSTKWKRIKTEEEASDNLPDVKIDIKKEKESNDNADRVTVKKESLAESFPENYQSEKNKDTKTPMKGKPHYKKKLVIKLDKLKTENDAPQVKVKDEGPDDLVEISDSEDWHEDCSIIEQNCSLATRRLSLTRRAKRTQLYCGLSSTDDELPDLPTSAEPGPSSSPQPGPSSSPQPGPSCSSKSTKNGGKNISTSSKTKKSNGFIISKIERKPDGNLYFPNEHILRTPPPKSFINYLMQTENKKNEAYTYSKMHIVGKKKTKKNNDDDAPFDEKKESRKRQSEYHNNITEVYCGGRKKRLADKRKKITNSQFEKDENRYFAIIAKLHTAKTVRYNEKGEVQKKRGRPKQAITLAERRFLEEYESNIRDKGNEGDLVYQDGKVVGITQKDGSMKAVDPRDYADHAIPHLQPELAKLAEQRRNEAAAAAKGPSTQEERLEKSCRVLEDKELFTTGSQESNPLKYSPNLKPTDTERNAVLDKILVDLKDRFKIVVEGLSIPSQSQMQQTSSSNRRAKSQALRSMKDYRIMSERHVGNINELVDTILTMGIPVRSLLCEDFDVEQLFQDD